MRGSLTVIIIAAAAFGAYWYWKDQRVDAVYYPNKSSLIQYYRADNVGSVEGCRNAVAMAAAAVGDLERPHSGDAPVRLKNGDYECGVGLKETMADDLRVYEETVR